MKSPRLWRKFPVWDASTTVLVDDDPASSAESAHTAICLRKGARLPPPGSEDEPAPRHASATDALRAALTLTSLSARGRIILRGTDIGA